MINVAEERAEWIKAEKMPHSRGYFLMSSTKELVNGGTVGLIYS